MIVLMKIVASGMELRVGVWIREILLGHTQKVKIRGQLLEEVRCTARKCIGSTLVSTLHK
jgi:hypothetical protein